MDPDLLKLLGSGGIVAALLALIYLVGNRLVAALDRVAVKVDENTVLTAKFDAKLNEVLDARGRTPHRGVPIPLRPASRSEDR